MAADSAPAPHRTPPYVSFRSFQTLLDDFKTTGVPPRIDRSVLTRFSGGLGSQLLVSLRSLGLMTDENEPTPTLEALVQSHGTKEFPGELRKVLHASYPFLHDVDLMTATPSMFAEAFKNATDAKEDVLRKCRTFYLHAAKTAGIDVGPRLEKGAHPRASGSAARKRRPKPAQAEGAVASTSAPQQQPAPSQKELEYQLIDLMSEPDIGDEVKSSIWSLVQYLTARKAKKQAGNA